MVIPIILISSNQMNDILTAKRNKAIITKQKIIIEIPKTILNALSIFINFNNKEGNYLKTVS